MSDLLTVARLRQLLEHFDAAAYVVLEGDGPLLQITERGAEPIVARTRYGSELTEETTKPGLRADVVLSARRL